MADTVEGRTDSRIDILKVVQTPLGFFVLVVLVVEALFLAVAGMSTEQNRMSIFYVMAFIIILLIIIVALIAYFRAWVLTGTNPPETSSEKLANLLGTTEGRELLRAVFRDCVEEYAAGRATKAQIEKKYGLRVGTVVELAKITTFIADHGHGGRPPRRRS